MSAYTALFLIFGAMLFWVHIPHLQRFRSYRTSRLVFGCAYLLLALCGISELLFPLNGFRSYITVYILATVSLLHAWLNAYAYLLMLQPSVRNCRQLVLYGKYGLPVIFFAGGAALFIPKLYPVTSCLLGTLYVIQITWMLGICYKEYRKCLKALDNFYDGTMSFIWMRDAIYLSVGLAFMNLLYFYLPILNVPLKIANALFYFYFGIRLLNYLPMFFYVEEAKKGMSPNTDKREVPNKHNNARAITTTPSGIAEKLEPLIETWTEAGRYCRPSLTLPDVAKEMKTNRKYLSVYLNRQLGVSFQTWLNTLRIEQAKILLRKHPEKSVEEIGRMVGIPESYNLSRWFKRVTRVSPQQWRKIE